MKQLILLFLFSISATAQIKGVVKDSVTKEPIAYVNIFTEEKGVFNAEANGVFNINKKLDTKITFQMLGYKSKTILAKNDLEVLLQPNITEIQEVLIESRKNKLLKEIDLYESNGFRFHNGNHGCAILLKNDSTNSTCKFINKIKFHTQSEIHDAKLRFVILGCSESNNPIDSEVFHDTIISVKKGKNGNEIDLSNLNISIPENGIFICFENLYIEENKYHYERTVRMSNGEKKTFKSMSYEPEISLVPSTELLVYYRKVDKWEAAKKIMLENPKSYENLLMRKYHNKYLTPSIKITLSN